METVTEIFQMSFLIGRPMNPTTNRPMEEADLAVNGCETRAGFDVKIDMKHV